MKRAFVVLGLFLSMAGSLKSEGARYGAGISGEFKDIGIWKSTDINHHQWNGKIATGSVVIGYVQTISTGELSYVKFQPLIISTNTGAWSLRQASVPASGYFSTTALGLQFVGAVSTTGWVYTSSATETNVADKPATIRVLWDYFEPPKQKQ